MTQLYGVGQPKIRLWELRPHGPPPSSCGGFPTRLPARSDSSYNHSVVNAAVSAYQEAIRLNPQFSQVWAELSMAQVGQTWLDDDMSAWH